MCATDGYDYDAPTVQTSEWRRAAKAHRCAECRREIAKGSRYEWNSMLWEGEWSTWRECPRCVALGAALRRHITEFLAVWELGGLLEAVRCELDQMTAPEKARFRGILREERRSARDAAAGQRRAA